MDLETQGVGGSQALLTVLQAGVSGGQEHPESLHRAGYPSVRAPPPAPHWLSTMGEQSARTPPEFVPSFFMGWPLPDSPAKRSNQSILKEINPEYSLEGLMLKLKLQYFGHLM